ncbi:MAG: glycosyltransferase family 39 protein [bacterium]
MTANSRKGGIVFPAFAVVSFALFLGYFIYQATAFVWTPLYPISWSAQWLRYPDMNVPKSFFRNDFFLRGSVASAWLKISADNDYQLYLNEQILGQEVSSASNTTAFQEFQSEIGQAIGNVIPFSVKNPPEAQWTAAKDWTVATFFDVGPYLKNGKNVIGVAIQTDRPSARFILEGEIVLVSGERHSLISNSEWKVSSLQTVKRSKPWVSSSFNASNWPSAQVAEQPKETIVANFDPNVFRLPMTGEWICDAGDESPDSYFRKEVVVKSRVRDAWIRISSQGQYDLFVNGMFAGAGASLKKTSIYSIAPLLHQGRNFIAVHLRSVRRPYSPFKEDPAPPVILLDGMITTEKSGTIFLATNESWQSTRLAAPGWHSGRDKGAKWRSSHSLGQPSLSFMRSSIKEYRGTVTGARVFWETISVYWATTILTVLLYWLAFIFVLSKKTRLPLAEAARTSLVCYWPALAFMVLFLLVDFRFAESPKKTMFYTPSVWKNAVLAVVGLVGFLSLWLILAARRVRKGEEGETIPSAEGPLLQPETNPLQARGEWVYLTALAVITAVGAYLRFKELGFQAYHSDESSSVGAVIGILKTGVPVYPSGVWYTRGPLFHYLAALVGWIWGVTPATMRIPAAVFGVVCIPILYKVGKELVRSRNAALLAAFLMAISPWGLFTGRSVRFYSQFQVFGLLSVYFFVKGFVYSRNKKYQNLTFVAFACTFLSQEVAVTLLPAFGLSYLYFTPRADWWRNKNVLVGSFLVGIVVVADALFFLWKCLTPAIGISATSESVMKLHISEISTLLATFLVGYNRAECILSFFFLLGLVMWFMKKDRDEVIGFLYSIVLLTILTVTITAMQVGLRYISELYPVYMLLGCYAIVRLIETVTVKLSSSTREVSVRQLPNLTRRLVVLGVLCALTLSYEPMRILASYGTAINRGDGYAHEWVKRHMRPGDIVVAGHHAGDAANAIGKCDYYIVQKGLFDEIFKKDGVMIDRRGGATIVDSVDKLRTVFENHDRVWIVISDLRLGSMHKDLANYIWKNTKLVHQLFLCNVFLWDKDRGVYTWSEHDGNERFYFQ